MYKKNSIPLLAWGIIVVVNFEIGASSALSLKAMLTKAKKFKSMEQQLKILSFTLWQINIFDWTTLKRCSYPTINAGQMMNIPLYRCIKNFTCWKISGTNQTFFNKYLQVSINGSKSHRRFSCMQDTVKFLTTQLIITISKFFKNLILTIRNIWITFHHFQKSNLISLENIS